MMKKNVQSLFIVSSIILLLLVLGFSGILNITAFKKSFTDSLVAGYKVAGGEAVRKIEYAVKYGKPLSNFYGIEKLMQEIVTDSPEIDDVRIVLSDGSIAYVLKDVLQEQSLSDQLRKDADFSGKEIDYTVSFQNGKYHAFLPIYDRESLWIGSLDIVFDQSVINSQTDAHLKKLLFYMLAIALATALILILLLSKLSIFDSSGNLRRKAILSVLLTVLGLSQLSFGLINIFMFRQAYYDMAREHTGSTIRIIQKDITQVVSKGVPYTSLYGIEDWLGRILKSIPQLESIQLIDDKQNSLYGVQQNQSGRSDIPPEFRYIQELIPDRNGLKGTIRAYLSESYINGKINDIILDTLTLLLTSFFFMVEITIFLLIFLDRRIGAAAAGEDSVRQKKVNANIIRSLAFLFFIANSMSVSFVPVLMSNFYQPLFGLPRNIIIGLPITAEMLGTILTTIIAGYLIDRKGWKLPFYTGLAIISSGILLCGFSREAISLIIARFVVGLGYGLSWMSMRGFVAALPDESERVKGFSALSAGIYAGINCGCVIGAMAAERIGFSNVFFIAFAVIGSSGLFVFGLMRNMLPGSLNENVEKSVEKKKQNALSFFLNPSILFYFLLIIIPSSIFYMFLNYFFPLYAKNIDVSSANTARAMLVYGLCIVYVGPALGKYLMKRFDIGKIMLACSAVFIFALLLFSVSGGFWIGVLTLFLLGLGDSVGSPAQNSYFLSIEATQMQGRGKALGFYSIAKKIGNMLGPVTFGWATTLGMENGVGIIGWAGLLLLAAFILISRRQRIYRKEDSTTIAG